MTRAFDRALPVAHLGDLFELDAKTSQTVWLSAPRSAFKSERDCARWNRRCSGQPVLGTPGGLRVVLVWNELRRKWQVQYVVGCRRYSVRSHSDYESADRDYRFAKNLFCLYGGESFIKYMGRPAKRVIFSDPTTLRGKRQGDEDRSVDFLRQGCKSKVVVGSRSPLRQLARIPIASLRRSPVKGLG